MSGEQVEEWEGGKGKERRKQAGESMRRSNRKQALGHRIVTPKEFTCGSSEPGTTLLMSVQN